MQQIANKVLFNLQITGIHGQDTGHGIPIMNEVSLWIMVNLLVGIAVA